MKIYAIFLSFILITAFSHCARDNVSSLEAAKFHLDRGEYGSAIEKATEAVAADPDNVEAIHILGTAYFGRSGIDLFDVTEALLRLDTSDDTNFQAIADALPDDVDMDDLRTAITTLETINGVDNDEITDDPSADAVFDLALIQAIEHYAIGVYESNFKTAFDVTGITDNGRGFVQGDLVIFDNRFIATGADAADNPFIAEIRQTFCILEPISGGEGFTLAEYQAFVGCQLSGDPDAFNTVALTAAIANCAALVPDNQAAAIQDCYDADTSL